MKLARLPSLLLSAACLLISGTAAAEYPEKPIRFVVPFASGTATDQIARALGQAITAETKQQVIVDNKPGANGFIGASEAAKAAADGYTVFITTNTTHAAAEHLYKKLPYDPVKDFSPITGLGKGGQIMVVNSQSPVTSVKDFIAAAKKNPGKLTFGSGSSSSRIAGEMLQQLAGIQILHVPYKSNTFAVTDLLGGQIDMMITDTATGLPHIKSGKLRALGSSTKKRSPLAPDVPTIEEAGVPGYDMGYWFAAYAPAKTPQPIVNKLNELFAKAASSATANTFYTNSGVDPFITKPDELAKFQAAESKKWEEIVKKAGIEKE
ncbi:tripartite tricarboxylate transporter substrate binding protein [Noviherbaspirillum sp. CPCC 100848]|uniref:Tripartite tricarboxylate transporter substrate binding protein n=1 Tax=Noviherbaspirillum album TaxID=3080276 RepID=A0ABU6J322_9BURK|nr:tripartite tricarboxylate transporter substrate binding protein [Noviherbaspirillum sp. CPCC 100848]MEC4718028.1 tripartite tricarboxylate transporter substrate binding protein [Noviherbaspirillum sp. CPCC 100848]